MFVRARRLPTSKRSTVSKASPLWKEAVVGYTRSLLCGPSVDSHSRYPPWVKVSTNMDVR